jgi:phosphoribosylaminoimidazolecarboxamide formyltransferase/IMP cyclohydrolase
VSPASYDGILKRVEALNGSLSLADRFELARKAFEHTAVYDRTIADYLAKAAMDSVQSCYHTSGA